MKKLISVLLAIILMLSALAMFSCDNDESSSSESKSESSSESTTESQKESESTTESQKESESESESTTEGQKESESESESEQGPTDPADIVDPDAPEDKVLTLFSGKTSDYVFYFDTKDEEISTYANAFLDLIATEYGVTLETEGVLNSKSEHRIFFGTNQDNAKYVASKLYEVNDFAISVCGDDLVIYATDNRLYPYVLELAKTIFDGEKTTFEPQDSIIYHKSQYKDMTYAEYIKGDNAFTSDTIVNIFEARSFTAKDGTTLPYRIYIPSSYNENEKLPVVTILHGAGERGNDNKKQLINMVPGLFSQKNSPFFDAIVIAPQCPAYPEQWVDTPWAQGNYSTESVAESNELKAVVELLESVKGELSTDEDRYYVMGISMGGFGTWDLISRHTEMFAAAVPLCGGADPSMAKHLVDFPIWTVHSTNDGTVPFAGTNEMVEAIKAECDELGLDPKITFEKKSMDHNVWTYAGTNARISAWLFSQRLSDRALDGAE